FEVGNNSYLERSRAQPTHMWILDLGTGQSKRLTSGPWSLPHTMPPGAPSSQLIWTADGKSLLFARSDSPLTGDNDTVRLASADLASGAVRPFAEAKAQQTHPVLSPDGTKLAFVHPRDGRRGFEDTAYVATLAGGAPQAVSQDLDH